MGVHCDSFRQTVKIRILETSFMTDNFIEDCN